ncbi:hypothetical protein BXZ70DRAFT_886723 [Cristinia sonorae]|uniref:Protein EFR3 n=1 Tax=Cristinia sonorae TaxID=1940300 RepID=A0A8K0XTJ5_9AGAR|nr:hypothetical protein BXZ70DRAFT_886723 [Cristinia sonorae]
MHFPFTPNHVQLIAACYPPNANLLTSGPDYRPNSQELSRLTYYASNRPGKINKLTSELERRVRVDCKKAQAGNLRARATLLITLAILKALATECRRDISLLSSSLLGSISVTLSSLTEDLEVVARAASVFSAWTTYTDGHLIGADRYVTEEHSSCLQVFSRMGRIDGSSIDHEVRNRTRLLGLSAVLGVVASDVLYYSSTQFLPQITTLIPALIIPLLNVDISTLEHEFSGVKDQPTSPYLSGFRDRPAVERRAASIHLHVDGDKGPSSGDVANTALRALSLLLEHSNANQAGIIIRAVFDCLDDIGGWQKTEHCQWLAVKIADWTQYQYRYAIPSRLVEALVEGQDAPQCSPRHVALAAMIKTVFTSPTPLVNLSTSDIISSLITLTLRRILIDTEDPLLPTLVECISSLGTHVYYADQIQDLAGELVSRLSLIETSGLGNGKTPSDNARAQAVRCLLAALQGLIHAADIHEPIREDNVEETRLRKTATVVSAPTAPSDHHAKPSRRTKVPPEVWHETLTLLCDAQYGVRVDYAAALVSYIKNEIPTFGEYVDVDGVRRTRPLAEGPTRQASTMTGILYGDSTTRLLNALHADIYLLATSSVLGINANPPCSGSSSVPETNGHTPTDPAEGSAQTADDSVNLDSPPASRDNSRRSTAVPPRTRKTSVMLRLMQNAPRRLSASANASASLSDYGNILAILTAVHENLPVRAILTGVPMLLALDGACQPDAATDPIVVQRIRVLKELLARVWLVVGRVWSCPEVTDAAEKALSSQRSTTNLPELPERQPGVLSDPAEPVPFDNGLGADVQMPTWDSEALLMAIVSNSNVQNATGLDRQVLLRRLAAQWTPESAYKESLEIQTSYDGFNDSISPLRKVAPALMHIDNVSLQSLARSSRGVGVTDLREALEGRRSMSNPNLSNRAPSLSTLEHTSILAHGDSPQHHPHPLKPVRSRPQSRNKLGNPNDVRDVLNKLGIGKQNGASMLKSSFPILQKSEQKYANL